MTYRLTPSIDRRLSFVARTALALLVLCICLEVGHCGQQTAAPGGDGVVVAAKLVDVPKEITAGVPVKIGFRVRHSGAVNAYVRVSFDIPVGMLLAATPRECFATFDREQRRLVYEKVTDAGWEGACDVALVARPDGSNQASFSLDLFTLPDHRSGEVATSTIIDPPTPAAISLGGLGITRAGLVFVCWCGLWLALYGLARATTPPDRGNKFFSPRTRAASAANAIAIGIGFLAIFVDLAWEDWRTISIYRDSRCEIVDLAFKHQSVSAVSDIRRAAPGDTAYQPVLSLAYTFDGVARQALGFSTDSRLSFKRSEIDGIVDSYRAGASIPCWVDPDDPRRVVALRGYGGAYVFAPLPLLLVLFGLWLWPRGRTGARAAAGKARHRG